MRIYLAGGVNANLKPMWHRIAHGASARDALRKFLGGNDDCEYF